jgi:hypothetical protein
VSLIKHEQHNKLIPLCAFAAPDAHGIISAGDVNGINKYCIRKKYNIKVTYDIHIIGNHRLCVFGLGDGTRRRTGVVAGAMVSQVKG